MKKEFIGYYKPTKGEKDSAWENGTFIFDTNALLNLYRYSKNTKDDFLNALEKIKERIFLPYHVASEFHKNRYSVIEDSIEKYKSLIGNIQDTFKKNIEQHFNQVKKHPSIDIDPLKQFSDDFIKKLKQELDKQKRAHPDYHSQDPILDKLTNIFDEKIGVPFNEEELRKIIEEGKVRYEKKIPPGYKDASSKSNKNEFGDLIVWKEIIKYAKNEKKPIILVTDDQKEDWWTIEKGFPIRPREELIKEFFDETGIRILIYNADRFLRAAKKRKLIENIDDKTLEEVLKLSHNQIYGSVFKNKISDLFKSSSLKDIIIENPELFLEKFYNSINIKKIDDDKSEVIYKYLIDNNQNFNKKDNSNNEGDESNGEVLV